MRKKYFQEYLDEIKNRCEKIETARSDDFGHDTDALLRWESEQANVLAAETLKLLKVIEKLQFQRNQLMYDHTQLNLEPEFDQQLAEILESK